MRKTHDYTHHYRGSWRDGGRCRSALYAPEVGEMDRHPVIAAAERDENDGSSVMNTAEYLAAAIVPAISPTSNLFITIVTTSRHAGSASARSAAWR